MSSDIITISVCVWYTTFSFNIIPWGDEFSREHIFADDSNSNFLRGQVFMDACK